MVSPDEVIDSALSSAPVVIFSKSYCPFCKRAKKALLSIGIKPLVLELDEREDGAAIQQELLARTGQRTVPSVWLDGNHIGGSDDTVNGVESGLFAAVDAGEQIELAEKAGAKHCGADDGLPCLCYDV